MADFNLEKLAKKLKKKYKASNLASLDTDPLEYLSTGNKALDLALEGGIAMGFVTEWSGLSGSGKSLFLQLLIADFQKKYNGYTIVLDRESAWFNQRAEELGIDNSKVIVFKPMDISTITDAVAALTDVLDSIPEDEYVFIAIDSISAFASEAKPGKADMGKKAKSIHDLFRVLLPRVNKKMSVHFTNQRTFKIGVLFGDPSTTTGGEGPKYYTTYRLKLDDKKQIKDPKLGNEIVGNWIEATVIKTRTGPNLRKVRFPFFYKQGVPEYGGYARLLADRNWLQPKNKSDFKAMKASTLKYKDATVSENAIEKFLEGNPELMFDTYPEYNTSVKEDVDPFEVEEQDEE